MNLVSDGLRLRMLKAIGADLLTIRGQEFYGKFISERQPIDMGGLVVEAHAPTIICRTTDVTRIGIVKDDMVGGLPDSFRVKTIDKGGDRTGTESGAWAGFHLIELLRS